MDISKVKLGEKVPHEFNVIIEIQSGGIPIKYEFDKDSGAIIVDRFILTPMTYPYNYGFLPHTLGDDGDPLDALVISEAALMPGSVIKVRPIGYLEMEDESGMDEKILSVPVSEVTTLYDNIKTYQDLPELKLQQIKHFFEHYKDIDVNKWVKVKAFKGVEDTAKLIIKGIKNFNNM